jgi:hypothetical protein
MSNCFLEELIIELTICIITVWFSATSASVFLHCVQKQNQDIFAHRRFVARLSVKVSWKLQMFFQAACEHVVFKQNFYVLCPAEWDSAILLHLLILYCSQDFCMGGVRHCYHCLHWQSPRSRVEGTDSWQKCLHFGKIKMHKFRLFLLFPTSNLMVAHPDLLPWGTVIKCRVNP